MATLTPVRTVDGAEDRERRHFQALRSRSTPGPATLHLAVPDLVDPVHIAAAHALTLLGARHELPVRVSVTRDDPARLAEAAAICELDGAAGLIIATTNPPADWTHETGCVLLGASHPTIPAVTHDSLGALAVAVGHLTELGHDHVLFIDAGLRADFRHADAFCHLSRSEGFVGHIERLGDGRATLHSITDTIVSGPATAVLVSDDGIADGLVRQLRSQGLRVPEEVSVSGYNHDTGRPDPVTSVDQGIARLVAAAHELLHGRRGTTTGAEPVMVELGTTVSIPPPRRK